MIQNAVTSSGDVMELVEKLREMLIKYVVKRRDVIQKITIEVGKPVMIEIVPTIRKTKR